MSKEGFTLAELIVAMVLIAIVSIVALEFMGQYQKLAFKSSDMLIAANAAREKMEQIYMDNPGNWGYGRDTPDGTDGRLWILLVYADRDYNIACVKTALRSR